MNLLYVKYLQLVSTICKYITYGEFYEEVAKLKKDIKRSNFRWSTWRGKRKLKKRGMI